MYRLQLQGAHAVRYAGGSQGRSDVSGGRDGNAQGGYWGRRTLQGVVTGSNTPSDCAISPRLALGAL